MSEPKGLQARTKERTREAIGESGIKPVPALHRHFRVAREPPKYSRPNGSSPAPTGRRSPTAEPPTTSSPRP